MPSRPETNLGDLLDQNSAENKQRLAMLKKEYEDRVTKSELGRAEKEACFKWLREGKNDGGKPITVKDLETSLEHFGKAEANSLRLIERYREKVGDLINRGILAPFTKDGRSRLQGEIEWFTNLPYDDPKALFDKRRALLKSEIDDPRRIEAKEKWERLPRAFREIHQKEWGQMDLEERLTFSSKSLRRHEAIKEKALALKLSPAEREKHREQLKQMGDFDERERFLLNLELELKKREEEEARKKKAEEKEQKATKDMGESREEKIGTIGKAKKILLAMLRSLSLSPKKNEQEVIGTYAIAARTARLRRKAEIEKEARATKDLVSSSDRDALHGEAVQIQMERLRHSERARHGLKKTLRPTIDDPNAIITGAKLVNREGREMGAEEFLQTEVREQRKEVKKLLIKKAGVASVNSKETASTDLLKKAASLISDEDMERATKDYIRKAA